MDASSHDTAISARNLTKTYRLFGHPGDRIKQFVSLGLKQYHREFTALNDVSFDIRKGETVGIIGRNGSGKSTLLQLICGILKPTSGKVRINGRVSALLELGAGFNPEFTGRENVHFQGALLGLAQAQIDERFDEIAAFADIGEFLDQPVRTYSSGMFVRLAFSVAAHVAPDILIVDEALSVGDNIFQHKCARRVRELVGEGTTLLLVSHDRNLVNATCDRCILLDKGCNTLDGTPAQVFESYYASLTFSDNQIARNRLASGQMQIVAGSGEANVEKILLVGANGDEGGVLGVGTSLAIKFHIHINAVVPSLVMGFSVRDRLGQIVFSTNTHHFGKRMTNMTPGTKIILEFRLRANLVAGSYSISTLLVAANDRFSHNYESRDLACFFDVTNTDHPAFAGTAWMEPDLVVRMQ